MRLQAVPVISEALEVAALSMKSVYRDTTPHRAVVWLRCAPRRLPGRARFSPMARIEHHGSGSTVAALLDWD